MRNILRQFSLKFCELPDMIENISILLRCLTVNIDSRNKKGIPIIFYITTFSVIACYFYVYLFNMVWFVFIRCIKTGDLVAAMVFFSLAISSELTVLKLALMSYNSKEVQSLVDHFLEFDAHVIPGTRFYNNMMKTLRKVKRRAVGFWVTIVVNGIVYNINPLFSSGRHLSEDLLVIYVLTFVAVAVTAAIAFVPIKHYADRKYDDALWHCLEPMLNSPNFEIATTLSSVAVTFDCFSVASTSSFIIILVGYVEANMISLSEEIKEIWKDAVTDKKEKKEYQHLKNQPFKVVNLYIKRRLIGIIEMHKANINLLSDVDQLFRVLIGAGFLCQTISIIAELLGGLENTYLEVPFGLVQIVMDCYIGQKVMDASVTFEQAVYDCKWEKFDITNKKLVLTILQNSQKTMKLSAGGMATMSMSCLGSVLRTIYSTYTALHTRMNKK